MFARPLPSAKNPVPGTYATRAPIARGSIALASSPSGRVAQTKNPPPGRVHRRPPACGPQRPEQRVASLPVQLAEHLDLLRPRLGGQVARRPAGPGGMGQHRGLGGQDQPVADRGRRERPADPQAGGERLGERAQVDDSPSAASARMARTGSASKASRPYGLSSTPAGRRRRQISRTRARRRGASVTPAGFWNVGTVYSSFTRRPAAASRVSVSANASGTSPSPSSGTCTSWPGRRRTSRSP